MIVAGVLRARRRSILWWSVAVAGVGVLYALFFPMMQTMDTGAMLSSFPDSVTSALGWDALSSGAGYLHVTVYGLVGMAVLLACAIGAGARLIAGEEEAGLLELELAAPVSRARGCTWSGSPCWRSRWRCRRWPCWPGCWCSTRCSAWRSRR